jgi:hypothetical protein
MFTIVRIWRYKHKNENFPNCLSNIVAIKLLIELRLIVCFFENCEVALRCYSGQGWIGWWIGCGWFPGFKSEWSVILVGQFPVP